MCPKGSPKPLRGVHIGGPENSLDRAYNSLATRFSRRTAKLQPCEVRQNRLHPACRPHATTLALVKWNL